MVREPTVVALLDRVLRPWPRPWPRSAASARICAHPGVDELGLAGALAALVERSQTPRLEVTLDVEPSLSLGPAVEVAVYRIVAEALTNASKHAQATRIDVRVRCTDRVRSR